LKNHPKEQALRKEKYNDKKIFEIYAYAGSGNSPAAAGAASQRNLVSGAVVRVL
jgi:hypothetical protein